MMGSILAETLEAENIEKSVGSLRDLFGAVFFVSVGMMVEPEVLIEHWLPILVLTLAVILGQMFFGTFSFFATSGDLRGAVQSGFSMVQIGEFAFIIAGLGQELGVTSQFLYPVVVAVSIVTTFFTPYIIKLAPSAAGRLENFINVRLRDSGSQLSIVNEKKVQLKPMMSKTFMFDDYLEAYHYIDANREKTMKVLISVDDSEP